MQWGREESDSSAGRKPETICCWLPAVPPPHLTAHLPSLLSLLFTLQSMKVLSHLLSGTLHTPGTPHTCSTEPSLHFISEFIFFIETLHSAPLLINLQLPRYPSCLSLSLSLYHCTNNAMHDTNTHIQIHTGHSHSVKGSL